MKTANVTSIRVQIQDHTLHARVVTHQTTRNAVPIILVHGVAVSSHYMLPTIKELGKFYTVFAPDLPGYGESDKPSQILTIQELADALLAFMQAMHIKKAVLLGNSFGCQIIVDFALRYPQFITRAVLVSPTMDPQARTLLQEIWRLLVDATHEPLSYFPVVLQEFLTVGARRTIQTTEYGLEDAMEKKLQRMHVKTLVIRGEHDALVSQQWVKRLTKLLPHAELSVIQKAAHVAHFSHPQALTEEVRKFLQREKKV